MLSEASFLATGYAIYGREILSRLYKTGKYEIAEVSVYGHANDPRFNEIPWKCYITTPMNEQEDHVYRSNLINEFGEYKINDILLDFKPDHVFTIKDTWMWDFILKSPYRRLFHFHAMPTVDASPQNPEWIDLYKQLDSCLTYTDWAQELLKDTYNGLPLKGTAAPCANKEIFKPCINKNLNRKKFGLDEKIKIFGTVMRNQPRKQFLDLTNHFKSWLDKTQYKDCYLYFHTGHPDVGWDMADIVKNSEISNRILFTYKCKLCQYMTTHFFQDALTICPKCGNASMLLPSTQEGITEQELASVYNLFDVYIQYSACEGIGMPQVEAAACGIPLITVDYSGMEDMVTKLGAYPMKPATYVIESSTHRKFAVMDEEQLHCSLDYFIENWKKLPKLGLQTKLACNKHYDWDVVTKKWMDVFNSFEAKNAWASPPNIKIPSHTIPQNLTIEETVKWMILNVAHKPELLNSHYMARLIRDLHWGRSRNKHHIPSEMSMQRSKLEEFTISDAYEALKRMCLETNEYEVRRVNSIQAMLND